MVSRYHVLAHNMLLPVSAAVGFTLPFDLACSGASAGVSFGPIGICGGIVIGGLAGCILYASMKKNVTEYSLSFDIPQITRFIECNTNESDLKKDDVQASEKPTEKDDEAKKVEDILKDTVPDEKTRGRSKQYEKPGGTYDDVIKDFESLKPKGVKKIEGKEGQVGTLPDGRTVTVRVDSTDKRPTLEIKRTDKKGKIIKIRYGEK